MSETNTTDDRHTNIRDAIQKDSSLAHTTRDTSALQRDMLFLLFDDPQYGQALRRELEALYDAPVGDQRVYANLRDLEADGLLSIGEADGRTNLYQLTPTARHWVREHAQQRIGQFGLAVCDDAAGPSVGGAD